MDSFVRTVGIYPAGSVVQLRDGQKAYVLDSKGPIVIPFTSREGVVFTVMQDPIKIRSFFFFKAIKDRFEKCHREPQGPDHNSPHFTAHGRGAQE